MKVFKLIGLINQLEACESGGDFAQLNPADVPGFDNLFGACEAVGVSFSSEGLRALARKVAARKGATVERILTMRLEAVATSVRESFRERSQPIPA